MTHDRPEGRLDRAGLLYLGIVYVVWGSTYLAIRLAVRPGAGFPPFTLGAMRVLVAAGILFAAAALTRQRLWPRKSELPVLIGGGLLLWPLANGLVVLGETRADSGFAALLVGSMPIWVAIMEAHLDRRLPTVRFMGALLIGFAGVALLAWPVLRSGARADVLAVVALLAAPITWGAGSLWQRRRPVALAPLASAAWQQFFGGLGFIVAVLMLREPRPAPTPAAWGAWAYLTLFGSVIAFTSYVQTLRRLPMRIVSTYAYVNPVVAVGLGWVVLREQVTGWTLAGASLVLLGVAGVFHERGRGRRV